VCTRALAPRELADLKDLAGADGGRATSGGGLEPAGRMCCHPLFCPVLGDIG
jgi:hypothetical protein